MEVEKTGIKLILPNTNNNGVLLNLKQGERLYFLAGPIKGGGDWQAKAIQLLQQKDPFCYIACPHSYDIHHELFKYQMPPTEALCFENQTMWERYYMERASWFGSIIFWLPCEDKQNPRKNGPYARDTYGEIARCSVKSSKPEIFSFNKGYNRRFNVIIGAEKDFLGLNGIKKNSNADHAGVFDFYSNLEDTITAAVKKGKEWNP